MLMMLQSQLASIRFPLSVLDCVLQSGPSAQFGEDWALLPTLLGMTASSDRYGNGRFVEIGAYQGVSLSNTFMLERCFNWTGVLIEANPKNFAVLKKSGRTGRLVHSAVCDGDGTTGTTVPMTADGMAVAGQVSVACPHGRHMYGRYM